MTSVEIARFVAAVSRTFRVQLDPSPCCCLLNPVAPCMPRVRGLCACLDAKVTRVESHDSTSLLPVSLINEAREQERKKDEKQESAVDDAIYLWFTDREGNLNGSECASNMQ